MENVKASVDDWMELQNLRLQIIDEQKGLEQEERSRYESEINYQRDLALKGYTPIEDEQTYNALIKDLGVTAETMNTFFFKDPSTGKLYLRPAATGDEKAYVTDLMTKYPDAGINFNDTVESAQAKLGNSRLYQQATRLSGGGGGGKGGTTTPELTGIAGALDEAANDVIFAEQRGAPLSTESWNNIVNQVAEAFGLAPADANNLLMQTVMSKKGELDTPASDIAVGSTEEAPKPTAKPKGAVDTFNSGVSSVGETMGDFANFMATDFWKYLNPNYGKK
jgi:hypothetical protein